MVADGLADLLRLSDVDGDADADGLLEDDGLPDADADGLPDADADGDAEADEEDDGDDDGDAEADAEADGDDDGLEEPDGLVEAPSNVHEIARNLSMSTETALNAVPGSVTGENVARVDQFTLSMDDRTRTRRPEWSPRTRSVTCRSANESLIPMRARRPPVPPNVMSVAVNVNVVVEGTVATVVEL